MRVGIPNDQSSSSNDKCIMLIDLIDSELQVTPSQKEGEIMAAKCLGEGAPDSFISEIPFTVIPEDGNFCFRLGHLDALFFFHFLCFAAQEIHCFQIFIRVIGFAVFSDCYS